MKNFDASEQAYKNGYEKGYADGFKAGLRKRKGKNETKSTQNAISKQTMDALIKMGRKAHGGEDG